MEGRQRTFAGCLTEGSRSLPFRGWPAEHRLKVATRESRLAAENAGWPRGTNRICADVQRRRHRQQGRPVRSSGPGREGPVKARPGWRPASTHDLQNPAARNSEWLSHRPEIEIDPTEHGPRILSYTVVDESASRITPLMPRRQVARRRRAGHGALLRSTVYDNDSVQLLSASSWTTQCRLLAPFRTLVTTRNVQCKGEPARRQRCGRKRVRSRTPACSNAS